MQTEIVIAGFGGQGILFAGQLLAYAGMDEGKEVTWFPSYGPEMRGGTANCTTIIGDEEIGAAVVRHPIAVIVMNLPSFDKYVNEVKTGGVLVVNSSLIDRKVERKDITTIYIPGNEIAEKLGEARLANLALLGGLLANLAVIPLESMEKALKEHLPTRHQRLLPLNIQALREGAKYKKVELN
jgi:2-oxoglutarate ferredoxin oxidoreductase subunit gamma